MYARAAIASGAAAITAGATGGDAAAAALSAVIVHLYNMEDVSAKKRNVIQDDYLSWEEAVTILQSNTDPNLTIVVQAKLLIVNQTSPFYTDPATGDVRASGAVMGIPEYLVHGQVTIRDRGDGTFGIYSQQFNFEQKSVYSISDALRNVETFVGGVVAGNGTPFWIQYDGNANVISQ
jgi:hypothetical protein